MVRAATRKPSLFEALFRGSARSRRVRRSGGGADQVASKAEAKLGNNAKGRVGSASRMTLG